MSTSTPGPLPLALCAALILPGCLRGQEERIEARHEVAEPAMARHELEAAAMRDALVAGRIDELHAAATVLRSRLPLGPGLAPAAAPFELTLAMSLDRVLQAQDLPTAADAVGAMAQACGDCHTALGLELTLPATALPPPGDTVQAHMRAHRAAAVELWQGVIAGDAARIQAAAAALQAATLVPSGTPADAPVPPDAALLEVQVQDLAGRAARAEPTERGHLVGEMLGTCAQCHLLLQAGPAAPVEEPADQPGAAPAAPPAAPDAAPAPAAPDTATGG